MSLTDVAHGSQTCVIGTEHTLNAATSAGTYVLEVDLSNLADGDVLEVRLKSKVLTGGTLRVVYVQKFFDQQSADDAIKVSVPIPCLFACTATLKQTAGTGRAIDWTLMTL